MEHFNKLTPAEAERLAILSEECGEVIQIIGKILRHGYESTHPDYQSVTNRSLLEKELGDLSYAVELMQGQGDIVEMNMVTRSFEKANKIKPYLHHQR